MKKIVTLALLALTLLVGICAVSCDDDTLGLKKDELRALIVAAEVLAQADYTSESWDSFVAALANAKNILSRDKPTVEALEAAIRDLVSTMTALVDSQVLRKDLATAIATAEAWVNNNYTDESWAAFQDALAEARRVHADPDATLSALETILERLLAAFDSLVTA